MVLGIDEKYETLSMCADFSFQLNLLPPYSLRGRRGIKVTKTNGLNFFGSLRSRGLLDIQADLHPGLR